MTIIVLVIIGNKTKYTTNRTAMHICQTCIITMKQSNYRNDHAHCMFILVQIKEN